MKEVWMIYEPNKGKSPFGQHYEVKNKTSFQIFEMT